MLDLERVAYHEAGHVVCYWLLDLPILSVEIHNEGGQVLNPDGIIHQWNQAQASYSGLAAECIHYDQDPETILAGGAVGDILNARDTIESLLDETPSLDYDEREGIIDRMRDAIFRAAIDELRAHWWAVEAVALALLEHRRLTYAEVLQVLTNPLTPQERGNHA